MGEAQCPARRAKALQGVPPPAPVMPAQPDRLADVPPRPLRERPRQAAIPAELEVLPPAAHVALPVRYPLPQGPPVASVPELADLRPVALRALRGDADHAVPSDGEAEEAALLRRADAALLPVDSQLQVPLHPRHQPPEGALRAPGASVVDGDVVRVAHEREPPALHFPVQRVKVQVRQQRARGATLGGTLRTPRHAAPLQHAGAQVLAYERQYPLVAHMPREVAHQQVVVEVVEEALDVDVRHPAALFFNNVFAGGEHRAVGAPPRSVAVAPVAEHRFENRCQLLEQGLLNHPVGRGGDAQSARDCKELRVKGISNVN